MQTPVRSYTAQDVFSALGYADPMLAARQQARMLLLGRLAHYEAETQYLQAKWRCTLDEMRTRYEAGGTEDFQVDDDYQQWQWLTDAITTVKAQLNAVSEG
jgi:hypothetical protein